MTGLVRVENSDQQGQLPVDSSKKDTVYKFLKEPYSRTFLNAW